MTCKTDLFSIYSLFNSFNNEGAVQYMIYIPSANIIHLNIINSIIWNVESQ